ncbi:DUF3180 domain-containing protein [Bogoriella caseilytica]|uniref:Uncharacterized protein DUF3180 n=1 Tax=Bogoriella caseilytica TaxID=56055 RepID=A0A3N2BB23_9MICO|nr:DUF3180 domain-containing protein [Bogoriella caseilytica]ROR72460.1 uncharacterized protein DUF3180 [Bogoriella caseilytica]
MSRTRWQTLVLIAVLAGVITFFVLANLQARGGHGVPVSPVSAAPFIVLGIVLLWLGRAVRRLIAREESFLTPIGASRVVVLAKSAALVGSGCVGYYAGQALLTLDNLSAPAPRQQLIAAAAALVGAAVMSGVAMLVERWCEVSPEDDEPGPGASAPTS